MELLLILLVIYLLVMPLVALGIANSAAGRTAQLSQELKALQMKLAKLSGKEGGRAAEESEAGSPLHESAVTPAPLPPPAERISALARAKQDMRGAVHLSAAPEAKPPPLPVSVPAVSSPAAPAQPSPPPPGKPDFAWEQFMGVKLFAWLGGLALFIGIVLFVKYAFDHNLIPPAARTAIGAVVGAALCLTGLRLRGSEKYRVLSHTLCATGVLILYGVSYAGHGFYALYSQFTAFAAVAAVTVAAFFIAVRMEAQVVSVLGMLGGFLAPLILYTGVDRPLGLFSYVALLDIGVLAVVHIRKWPVHTALAAAGTGLTALIWLNKFWDQSGYAHGNATLVPLAVLLFFPALFCAAGWWLKSRSSRCRETLSSSCGLAWMALLLCYSVILLPSISDRPWLIFGFAFLLYILTGAAAWRETGLLAFCTAAGGGVFLLLAVWSGKALTGELLPHALALYLIFGMLQAAIPVLWNRRGQREALPPETLWMPLLVLVLLLIGVLRVPESATGIWAAVLAVNVSLLTLGAASRQAGPVAAGMGLTGLTLFAWLLRMIGDGRLGGELRGQFLIVLTGFALVLTAGGCWLRRRIPVAALEESSPVIPPRDVVALLPAVLPFPLLVIAVSGLPDVPFAPVAAILLVLTALVLTVAAKLQQWALYPIVLAAVCAVELALHHRAGQITGAGRVAWYAAVWALLLAHPFLLRPGTRLHAVPWMTAAVAGAVQFLFIRDTLGSTWPNLEPGVLPALCALPTALGLWLVYRDRTTEKSVRLSQLAWFGGVTLLFITLIVPLQWKRQWLTVGWALEGAALCWLYRRVPHEGLRLAGFLLLAAAFVRLVFNHAALAYYPRTGPIWNWQLYTYGLVIAAHAAAICFLAPPRHCLAWIPLRSVLQAMAGVLLFVLINVEIADFFTPSGSPYIDWRFQGSFAHDMTVTIAWALYSLGLIVWGLWRQSRGARGAGVGLMGLTLAKLFLLDLASIGSLYRIAVTITVALIALAVSFLYQRFAARIVQEQSPRDSAVENSDPPVP